jgi:hypothetical protein
MQAFSGYDLHLGLDFSIAPIELWCLIRVRHVFPFDLVYKVEVEVYEYAF